MPARHWLGVFVVCAGCTLTGCTLIEAQRGWSWTPRPTADGALLEREFSRKAWRPQPEWNPAVELADFPHSPSDPISRWTHPIAPVPGSRSAESSDQAGTTVQEEALERFSGPLGSEFAKWNAAVVYAQQSPTVSPATIKTLQKLVVTGPMHRPEHGQPTPIPLTLRMAAAEAWCRALSLQHGESESIMSAVGWAVQRKEIPELVRDELLRGLGRGVAPRRIPGLAAALRNTDPSESVRSTRRAAIDACVLYAIHHPSADLPNLRPASDAEVDGEWADAPLDNESAWPTEVWSLRFDNDPYVRSRYAALLVILKHPLSLEVLADQLRDPELQVVRAACVSLGLQGSTEARTALEQFSQRPEERSGACAALGLACFGAEALIPLTKHKTTAARAEAVRRLGNWPSAATIPLVAGGFLDNQPTVQKAALEAAQAWPDPEASLALLQVAVDSPSLPTRRLALKELEQRHGTVSFPVDAEPQLRTTAAAHLTRRLGLTKPIATAAAEQTAEESARVAELRRAEIRERLDVWRDARDTEREAEAEEWFDQLTIGDACFLEEQLSQLDLNQEAFLLTTVLPRLDPAWKALVKLEPTESLSDRQHAARELRSTSRDRPLGPELLRRLHARLVREPDAQVWREVMQSLHDDRREEASKIVLLALHCHWPDIRQLGCEHVQRVAQPDLAVWVMPLFADENPSVKLAAFQAAAACQNPIVLEPWTPPGTTEAIPGLRSLLPVTQGELQLGVVAALSRLGDETGQTELIRLLEGGSPAQRTAAAKLMGETSQTRFIDPLIRTIWTETAPEVRVAVLASLNQLVPAEQRPEGLAETRTVAKAAELWNQWRENRNPARLRSRASD